MKNSDRVGLHRPLRTGGWLSLVAVLLSGGLVAPAWAGGGPENVFVVVNSRSWASQTVANHFCYWRAVPPANVFHLDWDDAGPDTRISIDMFREKILVPTLDAISERGLTGQIDYVVYSSDLPYDVDIKSDTTAQIKQLPQHLRPTASLTSLTYFWQQVLDKDITYLSGTSNPYAAIDHKAEAIPSSRAFHSTTSWQAPGTNAKRHFMLSTLLAVTSGRGTSVSTAVNNFYRNFQADGSQPRGTIYFMRNPDVRSKTRDRWFPAAAAELLRLGVAAEVVDGVLPMDKPDVMGCMVGARNFDWASTQSTILPGAICEHFTSTGAMLREGGQQTSLAEFLQYGAAGSSGTVEEPMALAEKFPHASLHVHYARGCTLAEAFYQSVTGPYQLLIVGDPLARPWARIARVGVRGMKSGDTLQGKVSLQPYLAEDDFPAARFELFVDGRRHAVAAPEAPLELDTTQLADGFHELRVVSIENSPIETQSRSGLTCIVDNHGLKCSLSGPADGKIAWGSPFTVNAESPGAARIEIHAPGQLLGTIEGESGSLEVDPARLGFGALPIWAEAQHADHEPGAVRSAPFNARIETPEPLPAIEAPAENQLARGLSLSIGSVPPRALSDTSGYDCLKTAGVEAGQTYELRGYFDVAADDVYQFQTAYLGNLSLSVDGVTLYEGEADRFHPLKFIPVALAAGTHQLEVRGEMGGISKFELRFGGQGTYRVSGETFRHAR